MILSINPRKTQTIRRLGYVDITALKDAVLAIPEDVWARENQAKPNKFDALDTTMHIPLRFVRDFDDWRFSFNLDIWGEFSAVLEPVLREATRDYGYKRADFPRIMLARMAPGGVIHPHRDGNPSARWPHKIHVPLQTNADVIFEVEGQGYHFAEGDAVEVNNMGVHAVFNRGSTARIHLIFEYYDLDQPEPAWIRALTGKEAHA